MRAAAYAAAFLYLPTEKPQLCESPHCTTVSREILSPSSFHEMIAKYRKQGKWNGLRGGYRKPAFPQGTGVERKTGTFRFPFHLNDPLCVTHCVCGFSSHEQFSLRNFTFFFSYEIFSVLQLSVSSVISVFSILLRLSSAQQPALEQNEEIRSENWELHCSFAFQY